jgi:hypothetical protein
VAALLQLFPATSKAAMKVPDANKSAARFCLKSNMIEYGSGWNRTWLIKQRRLNLGYGMLLAPSEGRKTHQNSKSTFSLSFSPSAYVMYLTMS